MLAYVHPLSLIRTVEFIASLITPPYMQLQSQAHPRRPVLWGHVAAMIIIKDVIVLSNEICTPALTFFPEVRLQHKLNSVKL